MPVIMFWNVAGAPRFPILQTACAQYNVDILILAEDKTGPGVTESQLRYIPGSADYKEYSPGKNMVRFYTRLPLNVLSDVSDVNTRVSIKKFTPTNGPEILIVAAHAPSKLRRDDMEQHYFSELVKQSIYAAELSYSHNNTIVIGDLNMNPFDPGMTAFNGFQALMTKYEALRPARTYMGKTGDYFYNPMWSRLGDESNGPPGTYFYASSKIINHFWNTFDQVLIRPSLLKYYHKDRLSIITQIGPDTLIKNERVDLSISDHLPLVLELPIEGATP